MSEENEELEEILDKGKLTEINVSVSVGGKIQIVKYQYSADYHLSMSQRYEVDDLSPIEAAEFREAALKHLRGHLENAGQEEIDELEALRERLNENEDNFG